MFYYFSEWQNAFEYFNIVIFTVQYILLKSKIVSTVLSAFNIFKNFKINCNALKRENKIWLYLINLWKILQWEETWPLKFQLINKNKRKTRLEFEYYRVNNTIKLIFPLHFHSHIIFPILIKFPLLELTLSDHFSLFKPLFDKTKLDPSASHWNVTS